MLHNKIKGLAMIATVLCISGAPTIANASSYQMAQASGAKVTQSSATQSVQASSNYQSVKGTKADSTNANTTEEQENAKLGLKSNWLTKEIAYQLQMNIDDLTQADLLKIKKIDLHDTRIEEQIPEEIGLLKNLEYLNLNECKLYGEIPDVLANLPKLTYLDLGKNRLKDISSSVEQKVANGKYTYCDVEENNFALTDGWYFLKGKWFYYNSRGDKLTGTQTIDGKVYQFAEDGTIKFGWETVNGKRYYYDRESGAVKNSWKLIDGKWYYFATDGSMQTGLQTINNVKYYLGTDGVRVTGWKLIWNKWYYFDNNGAMQYGWITSNGKSYYLDKTTGVMAANETKTIDGKTYRFDSDGGVQTSSWVNDSTYVLPNGNVVNVSSSTSHSNTNYQLFKYMTDPNNQASVDATAISLHGGITSNNCVYFSSEALRRVGVAIPTGTCNTYQFENTLEGMGFVSSYDFSQIKPGDIVFTNGYTHVYIFMAWDSDGYAYIVDNQGSMYGGTLHRRKILEDTASTDRATHFFYYPN